MKLHNDIYSLDALSLAPLLLGKLICRNINGEIIKARITETESYFGTEDTACHAHKGKTNRTKVLYEAGGIAYVYLCYGMHNLLNVVSGTYGHPEAVLIRGAVIEGSGKNFYEVYKTDLNGEDLKLLELYVYETKSASRWIKRVFCNKRFRPSLSGEIALRICFFLNRY